MVNHAGNSYRVHNALGLALQTKTADECATLLSEVADRFVVFREAMPGSLRGEWSAVTVLVGHWHSLVNEIASSAADELPGQVRRMDSGFGILTASHHVSQAPIRYLDHLIGEAPFSPLVELFGPDVGVGVFAVDAFRGQLREYPRLDLGISPGWPDHPQDVDPTRFRRLVGLALRSMAPPLLEVKDLFGLNNSEVAELFGVRRQAVDQWEHSGDVPTARRSKLANLLAVGELLERKLSPGRLPLIARRSAEAYGGITMLDMVAADRDTELRELTERAFDWSGTA